ncbi:autotransporter outer membrane beta-barrel domain-containing protein [Helicobacter himalayensis]|uniref:autotransporter outer membrane beta-barrel domain-containing protein n=1 Tax=Helicobacter himalayensis TaxID=1591088 RepID=UPI003D6DFFF4
MKRREFIKALCVFALFNVLNAYDFNATNFQLTQLPQPQTGTTPSPTSYYLYQQQQENLGVGFQFKGDSVFDYKSGTRLENGNIWIIGAGAASVMRRVFLDFSSNTQSFDSIGLNLRDGATNQRNEYVLLNLQYKDKSGQIARGVYYNPTNEYGKVLYNILGVTTPTGNITQCTAPNSCPQVNATNSVMVFRGVDVNDDMLQPYFSNDVLFGNALDSENFGVRVNSAVFKGKTIDFSGGYYNPADGQVMTTNANANAQILVFNGVNAIEQNQVEFKIGSGRTNISLYDLGIKSLNFSNLIATSILNLDSRASSIAGNLFYANADSNLNLIFASPTASQNITLAPLATHPSIATTNTTQSLSSIFADSTYLGGAGGVSGTIGINDNAQVTFIGANSHRFGATNTTKDTFQFIGDTATTTSNTSNVLFLNAGTLDGSIFTTNITNGANGNSKINFTLFGTSINNLNISDPTGNTTTNYNTLSAVFNAQNSAQSVQSGANTWDSLNSNLASYFQSLNLENSSLIGSATLGQNVRANLIFLGASAHSFSDANTLSGGSADSVVGFNNITTSGVVGVLNFDSIKQFRGQALVINSNLSANVGVTRNVGTASIAGGTLARYTHIFNGLGSNLSSALSQSGQNAVNEILSNFNNASGGLTNWSVSDLSATTSFEGTLGTGLDNSNFVFVGANALGAKANLSGANSNYTYTFVDFGVFDLDNVTGIANTYGQATIALAGNSYVRNNIGVAFSGTLDVSYANRFQAQSFFDNHIYGETKKDVVLNFGGDERGANYSNFHNGYIVEGTKDSIYTFSNIGQTLDFNKSVPTQTNYTASFDSNGDGSIDKTITFNTASNIQKYLISNGINFYVDSGKYGINGTSTSAGAGATIGFKDVSITGALSDDSFNIEAVFNSTSNLSERTYIDTSGNRVSVIESGAPSRTSSLSGTIGGDSRKRITFIGSGSFDDNLLISGGTSDSVYSFYSVGNLGQEIIDKIINAKDSTTTTTPTSKGSFNFDGGTSILANISKTLTAGNGGTTSASESINLGVNSANSTLSEFAQGVYMQGTLSGNITKNALFASGSSVAIKDGNSASTYDFSLSNNGLIAVKLDFANSARATNTITADHLHGTINGLNGLTSIIGTFENSVIGTDSISANQISFIGNPQGSGGQWFVPESSKIDSLRLSNDGALITNGSTRGATFGNALAIVDLSSYNWLGCTRDVTTNASNCVTPEDSKSYDYYEVFPRPLGAGFRKKTLTIAPSTMANTAGGTTYNSLFSSENGVFRLGLNLTQSANNVADEIKVILTTNALSGTTYLQLIQDASTASDYQYTAGGEKIYVASVVDSTNNLYAIDDNAFRATEQYMGLGVFRTELKTDGTTQLENSYFDNDPSLGATGTAHNGKQWYIDSVTIESIDDGLLEREVFTPLEGAVLSPYFNLYAETNNMAKRLGEVRGGNDSSGMWAKVIKGGIEGQNGYYGHNFGLQGGFDKVTQYQGTKVYLGLVGSFTSSWGSGAGSSLNARSDSFAIGFYRSALFADLSYLDIVGKYIYSRNEYTATSLSFAGRDTAGVSSGYVSAEYGRRFSLRGMPRFYFQPQAEVILGYIGAQNLAFRSVGSTLFVDSKANFVTIARVGADMLNSFRVNNIRGIWRVGGSVVKDFGARGEMLVRDEIAKTADRSKTIDSDFRVVFSFGFDMRVSQNSRIYLELDKSFFGTYNMDYVMSAGVRYNFGATPQRRDATRDTQPNFYDTQYIQYPSQQYLP